MDASTANRQLLNASGRQHKADDDELDELVNAKAASEPGKRTRVDEPAAPPTAESAVRAPAPRVDRRAEPTHDDVDDGALATAFAFIRDAATGPTLPTELAKRFAAQLRVDVDQLRIHTDASAAHAAAALNARAFTIGSDIYFAAGAYDPHSDAGIELIAHEMAHVAENQRGVANSGRKVSHPDDHHEKRADEFARGFGQQKSSRFESNDPAELVEHVRQEGRRLQLPYIAELEEHFGTSFDYVEAYTGEAAELACRLMEAGAFAVRNVVALADPTPQRDTLMHELTHVMQMGGRSAMAPSRFRPGSLGVGARGSAVEHEADDHAARPSHNADHNTVHRSGDPPKTNGQPPAADTPEAIKARVTKYCQDLASKLPAAPDKKKIHWGVLKTGHVDTRYYSATEATFSAATYGTGDRKGTDLAEAMKQPWKSEIRLHKAGGDNYIVSKEFGDKSAYVEDVVRVNIFDRWEKFHTDATSLKLAFKWPYAEGSVGTFDMEDPALTATEQEDYRVACRHAVALKYKDESGKFGNFYHDVCKAKKFDNKTNGSIFEELVALSGMGLDGAKVASAAIPVFDQEVLTKAGVSGKFQLHGDGSIQLEVEGEVINALTEAKAYLGVGPKPEDKLKMEDYKKLLNVPGYKIKGEEVIGAVFNHFSYHIMVTDDGDDKAKAKRQKTLVLWNNALAKVFGGPVDVAPGEPGGKPGKGSPLHYSLSPAPEGLDYEFKVKWNPEMTWRIPSSSTSINMSNPAVTTPGLKVTNITASLDAEHNVKSGSVTYGVEAADLKKPVETKVLTPAPMGGQVDNKLKGLTSKLTNTLPVDIDAAIVDDGVEATIKLKPGAIKNLAGFTVESAEVKATYKGGGTLSVDAEVGIKHTNGKISGKVKVSYDNGWTFEGSVKISEGLIPGVKEFDCRVFKDDAGEWKISVDEVTLEKQFGAIKLTGRGSNMEYAVKTGAFKGDVEVNADLGMFGKANGTAKIENNKLTKATLAYDSPELKYPKDKPVIVGTVGGTIALNDGKFSGDIRGTANLNIPALQKIAKEGVGLAVDVHVGEDGSYSGSIKSTKPIEIGKHLRISAVGCTLEKDGSISGNFDIEIINIKGLKTAKAVGTVDKTGVHITDAEATVEFGDPSKKFWGSITAKYSDQKGFDVTGTANYKIKDDVTATGTIKYSQETNAIGVELKVTDITLIDKKIQKTLFKASKQIPVVNIYGLGIYIDIGFDLGFDFGFKITLSPSAKVEDFSLDTMEYKRIAAKLVVGGDIYAQLTGTPKLGIGVFALDPSIIRGGGGLKVPIVGRLDIKPKAEFEVGHTPGGGIDGSAKLGLAGEFGIKGSVKPYAEFSLLNDVWNPKWEGEPLAEFEILKPKELFNFTVDLNSEKKQEDPELPGENAATTPKAPQGDKTATATPAAPTERGADGSKSQPAKQGEVAEGGDEGPFSLNALMDKLKAIPGFTTAKKIFEYGQKIWKVVKPIWDIVSPLMDIIARRIEEVIGLFDPGPGADGLGPWLWKLAKLLFNISFGGVIELASAIRTMLGAAWDFAKKLINKAVQDGDIGVKRHSYYIWTPWPFDDIEFMAAAEYKINVGGFSMSGGPPSVLLTPGAAVSLVLYEALDAAGVGITYRGNSDINQPYNDRWRGAGARG